MRGERVGQAHAVVVGRVAPRPRRRAARRPREEPEQRVAEARALLVGEVDERRPTWRGRGPRAIVASTSAPLSTPRQPSSQPPPGTQSMWLPTTISSSDSPATRAQTLPAASRRRARRRGRSRPEPRSSRSRSLAHVSVQATRRPPLRSSSSRRRATHRGGVDHQAAGSRSSSMVEQCTPPPFLWISSYGIVTTSTPGLLEALDGPRRALGHQHAARPQAQGVERPGLARVGVDRLDAAASRAPRETRTAGPGTSTSARSTSTIARCRSMWIV